MAIAISAPRSARSWAVKAANPLIDHEARAFARIIGESGVAAAGGMSGEHDVTGPAPARTRRWITALQIAGIAIVSAASLALHLLLIDTLLLEYVLPPYSKFGRWNPRYFLLVQDTLVGRVGIHAARSGTLRYEVIYDDDISFRIVRASYTSSAMPDDLRIQYGARCAASGLHPFQDEEDEANGDKTFSCARTPNDAPDRDQNPLSVTIHAGSPARVTLMTLTRPDD